MACALPTVASAVGGIPETFLHPEHGLLVPPADPAQMADAIGTLLREPRLRQKLGEQAAEYARRHYDEEASIDAYLDWFSEVLSGETPPARNLSEKRISARS